MDRKFNGPGLPASLSNAHRRYKINERRVMRWLLDKAEKLQIRLTTQSTSAARGRGGNRGGRGGGVRGRGGGRGGNARDGGNGPAPLPTRPNVVQLLDITQQLVEKLDALVPDEVLSLLAEVIDLRSKVSEIWSQRSEFDPSLLLPNLTHNYWRSNLEKVHSLLKKCGKTAASNSSDMQLVRMFEKLNFLSLVGLDDDEPIANQDSPPADPNEWLPDNIRKSLPKPKEAPVASRPLTDFGLDGESDDEEDPSIVAFFFLSDLERLREYVRGLWIEYRERKISLITASFLTTQVVEVCKEMERDVSAVVSQRLGGRLDYVRLVRAMMSLRPMQPLEVCHEMEEHASPDLQNFMMSMPFIALEKFAGILVPDCMPTPRYGFFPEFEPHKNRSAMSMEEQKLEDFSLLMTHMGEVATQAMSLAASKSKAPYDAALIRDMRPFLKDPSHTIYPHLVFQWELWKDMVLVLREDVDRPFNSLKKTYKAVFASEIAWENSNFVYDPQNMAGIRESMRISIRGTLKDDKVQDMLTEILTKYRAQVGEPYRAYTINPWACGVWQYRTLFQAHHGAVQLIGGSGFLSSTLQLYHCLRLYNQTTEWAPLQHLLDACKGTMWGGRVPEKGQLLQAWDVSQGGHPDFIVTNRVPTGYQRPGHGRGVLPAHIGGSILARICEDTKHHLTDELVAELLPSSSSSHSSRPDTYTLLDALKHRCEKELHATPLASDLFAVELFAICMFRAWSRAARTVFAAAFGEKYQERESQLPYMTAYLLIAIDARRRTTMVTEDRAAEILRSAVEQFEAAKQEVMQSLQGGDSISYPL